MTTCFEVANYFIWIGSQKKLPVCHLKLQKLVYYAQAWHLALYNKPLFDEDFEAWVHGAVIPDLYYEYRGFGHEYISWVGKHDIALEPPLFLCQVADKYMGFWGYEIREINHSEQPWINARVGLPPGKKSGRIITKESIHEYYSKLLPEGDFDFEYLDLIQLHPQYSDIISYLVESEFSPDREPEYIEYGKENEWINSILAGEL